MSISGPLELSGTLGSKTIYNTTGFIDGDYTMATILPSSPQSLWIIYKVAKWDHDHPDDRATKGIVRPGVEITMEPKILSAQGFDITNPGIILFEHSQYRGFGQLFQGSTENLTDQFTQESVSGVSSAIVTGGVWRLYGGYSYTDPVLEYDGHKDLGPGEYDFGSLSINDQAKSLKYIRADN